MYTFELQFMRAKLSHISMKEDTPSNQDNHLVPIITTFHKKNARKSRLKFPAEWSEKLKHTKILYKPNRSDQTKTKTEFHWFARKTAPNLWSANKALRCWFLSPDFMPLYCTASTIWRSKTKYFTQEKCSCSGKMFWFSFYFLQPTPDVLTSALKF